MALESALTTMIRSSSTNTCEVPMANGDLRRFSVSQPTWRYVIALIVSVFAVLLRVWLTPFLSESYLYQTAFAAVAFSAWYCGVGPSVLTVLTSVVGIWLWFLSPHQSRLAMDRTHVSGMIGFLLSSSVIIAFGQASRRAKSKAESTAESLRKAEERLTAANQDMQDQITRRTAELEQKASQVTEQARLLDLANDAIFVRDAENRISYWNQGAERLYGWRKEEALGRLTHELLHTVFPIPLSEIATRDRWEGELRQIKRDGSEITVASRWTTLRSGQGSFVGWLEINTNITARKRAEEAARRLSGRLLTLQDDERRKIGRNLHDSLGQYLAMIKLNLDLLGAAKDETERQRQLAECLSNVDHSLAETRTISHLLHPPLLDEAGFTSATQWYVEGFAQRSGLKVNLEFPPEPVRLGRDVETALFRILQESLTNVHRHSGASVVRIFFQVSDRVVQLKVIDDGRGISAERLCGLQRDDAEAGVGLAGMRQRMRELGGSLEIESTTAGTMITARVALKGHNPALARAV